MGATRAWTDGTTGSSYMCMDHQQPLQQPSGSRMHMLCVWASSSRSKQRGDVRWAE
jgi:hypothetical protein